MDLLTKLLAGLFDKFKANNPKLAAGIIMALLMIIVGLENGLGDLIGIKDITASIIKYINILLLALQGSRTSRYINKPRPA